MARQHAMNINQVNSAYMCNQIYLFLSISSPVLSEFFSHFLSDGPYTVFLFFCEVILLLYIGVLISVFHFNLELSKLVSSLLRVHKNSSC